MSGVFGLVRPAQPDLISAGLEAMAAALRFKPWSRAVTAPLRGGQAGLGQANIGIFSSASRPVFSPDGQVAVVAFGWARSRDSALLPMETLPELALRLYEQHGPALAACLEGEFVVALWDGRRRRLLLTNDRNALLPVYYTCFKDGGVGFAPTVDALLRAGPVDRRLNLDSVAEYMRFQRILGSKTFFEDIHALPYASYLLYEADRDRLDLRHYWIIDAVPAWHEHSFSDTVAEAGQLLRASVNRALELPGTKGIFLSGGMDSRTLLGFANQAGPPLPTLTYGHPASTDVRYARQLARWMGNPNRYVRQKNGRYLLDHIDLHLRVTAGHVPFIHAHAGSALLPGRQTMQINLMGHQGDHLLGGVIRGGGSYLAGQTTDPLAFRTLLFTLFNQEYSWPGITESEERLLYTPTCDRLLRGRAFDSFSTELRPFEHLPPHFRLNAFTLYHSYNQAYLYNEEFMRTHFEVVNPFCDYHLQDYLLTVPYDYRLNDRLYLEMINREIPRVTLARRDTDNLLPTNNPLLHQIDRIGSKVIRRLRYMGRPPQQLHSDPESWLRDDLRDWVAGVLFDPRTLDRGIFNPDFLRSIYARHMGGHEIWTVGKIAHLVTFELMLRNFFDGSVDPGWPLAMAMDNQVFEQATEL